MKLQKSYLNQLLLEEQVVSGPPIKSINNSGLGVIKRILIGGSPFLGGERYLQFGTEMHLRALKRKKGKWKPFAPEEAIQMEGGVKALFKCKLFTESYYGAIIEKTIKRQDAFGIWGMHGTLDLNNKRKKIIIDLKTTSAETEEEFVKKAIQLAYPRQGEVYEELDGNTKETFFIGISKKNIGTENKPEFPIFIFDLNNYEKERKAARAEAEFLLTFYRENGFPIDKHIKTKDLEGFKIKTMGKSFNGRK